MARSSTLTDDVDPAPRVFRLLASSLIASGEPAGKRLARRLRRDADVLEGATMTADESNRPHSRMLSRERRVRPVRNKARDVVVGQAPAATMGSAGIRHYAHFVALGEIPLDSDGVKNAEDRAAIRALVFDEAVSDSTHIATRRDLSYHAHAAGLAPRIRAGDEEALRLWLSRWMRATPEWRKAVEDYLSRIAPAEPKPPA